MASKRNDGRTYQRARKLPDGQAVKAGPYWIEYYDSNGKQQRESTGLFDFKAADAVRFQRILEKRKGTLVTPKTAQISVGELLDDLLSDVKLKGKNESLAIIHSNHLRSHFGQLHASKVGTAAIEGYIEKRLSQGVCGGTINRELSRLRRAFQLGLDREPPKVLRIPKFPRLRENPPRSGFLEREDYEHVFRRLPEALRPVLCFAYYSGCRLSEVLSICWDQVDFAGNVVRLQQQDTKTKEPRLFAMAAELREILRTEFDRRQLHWPIVKKVFTRGGTPIKDFRQAWTVATAGVAKPDQHFHDLRRTAVRNMVRAGIPEAVAMRISGHKTRSVFERYNIVSERDLLDAARKMEAHQEAEIQRIKDNDKDKRPQTDTAVH
jgi:integrase